jgi:hypothetical protein
MLPPSWVGGGQDTHAPELGCESAAALTGAATGSFPSSLIFKTRPPCTAWLTIRHDLRSRKRSERVKISLDESTQ